MFIYRFKVLFKTAKFYLAQVLRRTQFREQALPQYMGGPMTAWCVYNMNTKMRRMCGFFTWKVK